MIVMNRLKISEMMVVLGRISNCLNRTVGVNCHCLFTGRLSHPLIGCYSVILLVWARQFAFSGLSYCAVQLEIQAVSVTYIQLINAKIYK